MQGGFGNFVIDGSPTPTAAASEKPGDLNSALGCELPWPALLAVSWAACHTLLTHFTTTTWAAVLQAVLKETLAVGILKIRN